VGLVLLLGASPAWSQAVHTGTVTGTVILQDGTPSPGATVVIEGPALVAGQWSTVSDNNGRVVFLRVPPGTYTAAASLSGFNTAQFEDVVVNAGATVPLTFNLEIAAATGEIVVTSEAPIVDTRSSTIPTSFDHKMLEAIPTSRESFYDLALTAPGMADTGVGAGDMPSPSAYGSATDTNMFLVNGVNVTSPRGANFGSLLQVNYDTVQEFRVLALGSQAEYGSFSGAAIDVLTRSGSNEFHGSVGYYTQLGEGDSNATTSFGADWLYAGSDPEDLVTLPVDEWEAALTIGGPIVKDTLWFYFGFDRREDETDPPGRPLNLISEVDIYDLKLTGQFGNSHRAWLGFHYEDILTLNQTWGPFDASMSYHTPSDNTSIQAEYQWVASDANLFGFKYLGFETDQSPYIDEVIGAPGYINWWKWIGQAIGTGGDFPYIEAQKSKRDTLQADFTHYADDWAGQHELKFGVQYTTANGDWLGGYFQGSANFAYPYPWWYTREYMNNAWFTCATGWPDCISPPDTIPMYVNSTSRNPWLNVRESNSIGGFVDDQWVISDRITLNLGLRYDNMTADYGQGAVYEHFDVSGDIDNPTLIRTTEGFDVFDFKTWSPRLGIAWTLTGDGKTVLRAHAGRYYSPISVESLRRLGPDMGDQTTSRYFYYFSWDEADLNGNDWVDPEDVIWMTQQLWQREPAFLQSVETEPASWRLEVDPSTSSPYTDQFNISIQRQLGRDLAIEASYIYKKTQDFIILSPYNVNTGEFYEHVGRPYTTSAGHETTLWGVRIDDFNGDGVIDNEDASEPCYQCPTTGWRARNAPEFDGQTPDRVYQGFQVVLAKRYSNRWQGNFAINYTDTDGFYPRVVDQNFYADMPLLYDTPLGSTPNHFTNNLSGPAMMTPEWMAKLAGSYTIPVIETDFGFRIRYDSGRPIWEIDSNLGPWWNDEQEVDPEIHLVNSGWHEMMVAQDANDPNWLPSTTIVDLNLRKRFGIGRGMGITASFDALNAFNESSANSIGYSGADIGAVYGLIRPRIYRLGLKFDF
jgi:outer membrane receptor protein involved in Fe transport